MDCVKADPPVPHLEHRSAATHSPTPPARARAGWVQPGGAGHETNKGRAGWKSRDGSSCNAEQQPQPSQAAASWCHPGEPPPVQQETAHCLLLHRPAPAFLQKRSARSPSAHLPLLAKGGLSNSTQPRRRWYNTNAAVISHPPLRDRQANLLLLLH